VTIREYIRSEVFAKRAEQSSCMVIYDPTRRYRDIVSAMASASCRVIDIGLSIIEQREAAMTALGDLADGKIHQLIVWAPALPPESDEDLQKDPFSVFAKIGTQFPDGDGDDYASLCRKAKPDHVVEINRLFSEGEPSFDTIDALDKGEAWPKLKTLLNVNSPKEILVGLLSPTESQEHSLKKDGTWATEAREFILRSLGHKLKTKGQTRQTIADELWQLILFSEFVFDSDGNLPTTLSNVPLAEPQARGLIFDVCDELRKHQDHRDSYLTQSASVEKALALPERAREMNKLGHRDTFPFEERHYLGEFVDSLAAGKTAQAREILESRQRSIWLSDESRLAEWTVAERVLELLEVTTNKTLPIFTTLEEIIHAYGSSLREIDRRYREMEQSVAECHEDHEGLDRLVTTSRSGYLKLAEQLQAEFVRLVENEGWPASGQRLLRNSQVFDREVAPLLDAGQRVAYFLVDSLRYELAIELEKQLSDNHTVRLVPVCAQLPTYTEVGMASLMPGADTALSLAVKDKTLVTTLDGTLATTPATRFAYLKSKKGDLCQDIELDDLIRQKKLKIDNIRLLVVRTRDIDTIAHSSPHQILEIIPTLIRQIIRGISKVEAAGFHKAVIATDHGFILIHEQEAGNLARHPPGNWLVEKARCLLGEGTSDTSNLVFKREHVGIRGEFDDYAVPKALVPYSRGNLYFHEGLSLQECVLPLLSVELKQRAKKEALPSLQISYRQGKTDRITSRRPVIDISWPGLDMYDQDYEIELSLEVIDPKGNQVGVVGSGQTVNLATQGVRIRPGLAISVGLRMDDDFSGTFTVRALDPATQATISELTLKTAYIE
jgi:PglZ domain